MVTTLLQVAAGGAIGASLRYLTGVAVRQVIGTGFPWGTVIANLLGSFLMGVLVVTLAHKGGTKFAPFLMVGCLGGFTTFSSFSLDAVTLYERGDIFGAASYVIGSVVLGILALFAAMALMRWVLA